jgi:hypothetical protein
MASLANIGTGQSTMVAGVFSNVTVTLGPSGSSSVLTAVNSYINTNLAYTGGASTSMASLVFTSFSYHLHPHSYRAFNAATGLAGTNTRKVVVLVTDGR